MAAAVFGRVLVARSSNNINGTLWLRSAGFHTQSCSLFDQRRSRKSFSLTSESRSLMSQQAVQTASGHILLLDQSLYSPQSHLYPQTSHALAHHSHHHQHQHQHQHQHHPHYQQHQHQNQHPRPSAQHHPQLNRFGEAVLEERALPRMVATQGGLLYPIVATPSSSSSSSALLADSEAQRETVEILDHVTVPSPLEEEGLICSSVLKKRRRKMNRHKYKKWRRKMRFKLRQLGK